MHSGQFFFEKKWYIQIIAQFLTSIFFDAKHEKIVKNNKYFFLFISKSFKLQHTSTFERKQEKFLVDPHNFFHVQHPISLMLEINLITVRIIIKFSSSSPQKSSIPPKVLFKSFACLFKFFSSLLQVLLKPFKSLITQNKKLLSIS